MSYLNRKKKLARGHHSAQREALDLNEQRALNRHLSHKAEMAAADARIALGRFL
jgi:hypothetical protein